MNRYWILDPVAHRKAELEARPREGEMVETAFGPMPVVASATLEVDDWICDFCNDPMLVRWGYEPWPVATVNSYAICPRCQYDFEAEHGPWPMEACACEGCMTEAVRLFPALAARWN